MPKRVVNGNNRPSFTSAGPGRGSKPQYCPPDEEPAVVVAAETVRAAYAELADTLVRSSTEVGTTPSTPARPGVFFSREAESCEPWKAGDRSPVREAPPKVGLCPLCGMIHEIPGVCP